MRTAKHATRPLNARKLAGLGALVQAYNDERKLHVEHLKSLTNLRLLGGREVTQLRDAYVKAGYASPTGLQALSWIRFEYGAASNRSVSAWTRGVYTQRLNFKAQMRGSHLLAVNPAYSSQLCPDCGFVDSKNRTGDRFCCLYCRYQPSGQSLGYRDDALDAFPKSKGCSGTEV